MYFVTFHYWLTALCGEEAPNNNSSVNSGYASVCSDLELGEGIKSWCLRGGKQQWKLWDHPGLCSWLVWLGASPAVFFKQTRQTGMPSALPAGVAVTLLLLFLLLQSRKKNDCPLFSTFSTAGRSTVRWIKGSSKTRSKMRGKVEPEEDLQVGVSVRQ